MTVENGKKNGLNFSLTITLRDIIWTIIAIITIATTYTTLVKEFEYHKNDRVAHLTQQERQEYIKIQVKTEEHLKNIDEKLNQIIKQINHSNLK